MNFKVLDIEMSNNENLGFTISGSLEKYLRVANVSPNGLAFKAGLHEGDCILTINGTRINDREDIINSIKLFKNKVKIKIKRYYTEKIDTKPVIRNHSTKEYNSVRNVSSVTMRNNDSKRFSTEINHSYNTMNIHSEKENSNLIRRRSTDLQSLHHNLLTNLGSKIDMEISRSPAPVKNPQVSSNSKLSRRCSTVINLNRHSQSINVESEPALDISRYQLPRKKSFEHSRPIKPIDLKCRKLSNFGLKPVQPLSVSVSEFAVDPATIRRVKNGVKDFDNKQIYASRSWSLRKKSSHMPTLFQNQSLYNISNIEKSCPGSPLTKEFANSRTVSMTKTGSMVSLFDDDTINSPIVEYNIDWRAICEKISEKLNNEIEKELINYFHNSSIDLKRFPSNCLHWFMTFDDVLSIVCNDILPAAVDVDFCEEISKIPTQMINTDHDVNLHDVISLIKLNTRNLQEMVADYKNRKSNLGQSLEMLKISLERFLIKPESLNRVQREIHNIITKLQLLSDVLILVITQMSTWKLNKDFPQLNEHKNSDKITVTFCEKSLIELRDSQKILETQIMKLFKQFNEDMYDEVLQLFDQLFSENLEVSICVPILEDKLNKVNQMLAVMESSFNEVTVED